MSETSNTNSIVVLVTIGSADEAATLAKTLVDEKLAACCNVIEKIRSIYRWEGKVCDEGETLLMIKTIAHNYDKLEKRIKELHSYQVPEIIAIDITRGFPPYLVWLKENSQP